MNDDLAQTYNAEKKDPYFEMEQSIENFRANKGECDNESKMRVHADSFSVFMGTSLEKEEQDWLCEKARRLMDENERLHEKCLTLATTILKSELEKARRSFRV